jgi:Flp pilus assembly protein TadG
VTRNFEFASRFNKDKKGSVAVIFALTAIPVIGIVGLSLDVGRAMSVSRKLQSAVDAAVVAGTKAADGDAAAASEKFLNANAATLGAHSVSASFTITAAGELVGNVTANVATSMFQLMKIETIAVNATASAKPGSVSKSYVTETITKEVIVPGAGHCIHVLDQNTAQSLKLIKNTSLSAPKCEIHVRAGNSDSIKTEDEVDVTWKKLRVKGSGGTTTGALDTILDEPKRIQYNANVVGDPYTDHVQAVVRSLPTYNCSGAPRNQTFTNTSVNPGVYCGTTTFDGVTFNSGLYIIASNGNDAGRLVMKGTLDGSAGISFYFADNKAGLHSYEAAAGTYLKALESGISQGLLFFEASNRGSIWSAAITSLAENTWSGVIYLPSANLTIKNWTADPTRTMSFGIVANQLHLEGWTGKINTYEWTPFGYSKPINLPDETITVTETVTREVITEKPGRITQ